VVHLRPATADDADLLVEMVALAADWRVGTAPRSSDAVLSDPHLARYAVEWPRPLEHGVVAEVDDHAIGATWWRFFPAGDPGYGYVADDVPELTLAVRRTHRGLGVGAELLRALVDDARGAGLRGLSLSVEPDNPASRLYTRLGFSPVGGSGGAVTMLRLS
jgi:GNAT superfamily N-acetyltransferase